MVQHNDPKVIVALDHLNIEQMRSLVSQLYPDQCRLKVGITLFTQYGPALIEELMSQGFAVFLDLKFHDIPQQVAGACYTAACLGVWMMSIHIQGGVAMLESACNALLKVNSNDKPLLIGVTVLTSFDDIDLQQVGIKEKISDLVPYMAKIAHEVGLQGVVCSPQEVSLLRSQFKRDFLLVTPGIRLDNAIKDDQKRIMTPKAAIAAGANYLVIGRPVSQAEHPSKLLQKINAEIIKD